MEEIWKNSDNILFRTSCDCLDKGHILEIMVEKVEVWSDGKELSVEAIITYPEFNEENMIYDQELIDDLKESPLYKFYKSPDKHKAELNDLEKTKEELKQIEDDIKTKLITKERLKKEIKDKSKKVIK